MQLVAGRVAERVVDVLEAVEVEHEHGALGAVAARACARAVELLLEAAPVEQAGERVVVGQVLELLLEALALGDVLHLAQDVVRTSVRVAQDGRRQRDPDLMAVRVEVTKLGGQQVQAPGEQRLDVALVLAAVFGVHDRGVWKRQQIAVRVAGDRAQRAVDAHVPAVRLGERHPDRRAIESSVESLLGGTEHVLWRRAMRLWLPGQQGLQKGASRPYRRPAAGL